MELGFPPYARLVLLTLPEGSALNLLLPLPLGRMVSLRAQVRSRSERQAGLEFAAVPQPARDAIADYVHRRLLV